MIRLQTVIHAVFHLILGCVGTEVEAQDPWIITRLQQVLVEPLRVIDLLLGVHSRLNELSEEDEFLVTLLGGQNYVAIRQRGLIESILHSLHISILRGEARVA